jgi:hypothetical protein
LDVPEVVEDSAVWSREQDKPLLDGADVSLEQFQHALFVLRAEVGTSASAVKKRASKGYSGNPAVWRFGFAR